MITEYKHWVFSASNERYADAIKVASDTAKSLERVFWLDNDVVECAYHSTITVQNDGYNTEYCYKNAKSRIG